MSIVAEYEKNGHAYEVHQKEDGSYFVLRDSYDNVQCNLSAEELIRYLAFSLHNPK